VISSQLGQDMGVWALVEAMYLTNCQDGFGLEVFGWKVVEANQDGIIREDNMHSPI
jgi:hypothetical protein